MADKILAIGSQYSTGSAVRAQRVSLSIRIEHTHFVPVDPPNVAMRGLQDDFTPFGWLGEVGDWVMVCLGQEKGTSFSFKRVPTMRIAIAAAVASSIAVPALAQTQRTQPSAYATQPTLRSAFPTSAINPCSRDSSFNPTSPCYSGTSFPSYSAVPPFELPNEKSSRAASEGANSLDEDQARLQIEAKGYLDVSGLQKDSRGIWRGKGTLKDGRPVYVTLDLEGNIYSELDRLVIEIRPPRFPQLEPRH